MIFEKANLDDIDALVKLRIDYLTEDYGDIPKEQIDGISEKLPDYYRRHIGRDLFVYVSRDREDIVSCCFLLVTEKPSNPTFINGLVGTVLNVYTKPDYRKKGLAGKLVQMLVEDAEKMRLDFVELKATDAGYGLYKSVGFEDVISKYHNMKILLNTENLR